MGFIRNLAVKTAIKKALLDVNAEIERLAEHGEDLATTYCNYVELYFDLNPEFKMSPWDPNEDTWEGAFAFLVAATANAEMPTAGLIRNKKELDLLCKLICQWLIPRGGDPANVERHFASWLE